MTSSTGWTGDCAGTAGQVGALDYGTFVVITGSCWLTMDGNKSASLTV